MFKERYKIMAWDSTSPEDNEETDVTKYCYAFCKFDLFVKLFLFSFMYDFVEWKKINLEAQLCGLSP